MAARVDVPGIGPMYFPDEMSDDEIRAQVQGMSRREERSLPDESIRPTSLGRRGAPGFSEDKAFSYLQGSGMFDTHHTAGIIGNLYQESGLDPNAINPKSGAYGIGQWLGPRKKALFDYALDRGTHPSDPYLQMDFLMHELRGSENKAYQQLLGAGSPEDAALAFSKGFERAGAEESRDSARARRAQAVFGRFGGQGAGPAPTDELQFDPREIPLADLAKAGMYRGAQNIFSGVTDVLPSMAARQFGFDDYAQQQEAERAQALRDIQENYPSYFPDLESVTDVPSGMGWLAERVGEQLPTLPAAIGPGLVGRVGAAALGRAAATRAIPEIAAERGLVGEAAEALAQTPAAERLVGMAGRRAGEAGLTAGLTAGSALVNIPETYEQIYKETGEFHPAIAAGFGTLKAGLDTVFNQRLLRQLTPGGRDLLAAKIAQESDLPVSFKKAFLKEAGKNFATEGGTEAAQDFIDSLAAQAAGSKEALLSKEHINSWLESGLVGGVIGGGLGAPGAALEASRIKAERQAAIDRREQGQEQLQADITPQVGEQGPQIPPIESSELSESASTGLTPQQREALFSGEATQRDMFRTDEAIAREEAFAPLKQKLFAGKGAQPDLFEQELADERMLQEAYEKGELGGEGDIFESRAAPYRQQFAEEKAGAKPELAEPQFSPVVTPELLKGVGLTPQSGFFKQLVGKDISKPEDRKVIKDVIGRVQKNPKLAQSTKDGVRSLYTQAIAMYGKQGDMFPPAGKGKKGVSGAGVPTRVVGGGGGAGVQVPSGPEGAAPAGGVGIPEQTGMATSEPVATGSQRGEATQPGALEGISQLSQPSTGPKLPARGGLQEGHMDVKKFLTSRGEAAQKTRPTTLGELLQHHLDTTAPSQYHDLARKMMSMSQVASVPIKFVGAGPEDELGGYKTRTGDIEIYDGGGWHSVFHEGVHAATVKGYAADKQLRSAVDDLHSRVRIQAKRDGQTKHYGISTPLEFLSEAMTNPEFQDYLKSIQFNKNQSFWDRLLQSIKNLFLKYGLTPREANTALDAAFNVSETAMEATKRADTVKLTEAESGLVGATELKQKSKAKPIDFSSPNGPFQTVKGMDRFINSTPVFGESQKGILSDAIRGASDTARSAILGFLPTHALSDLASRYFPPGVAEAYHAGLRSLDGYLHELTEKSVDVIMHKYRNARRASAKQNDLFNKVANQSTIYEVDPSDPSSIANATKFSMGYVLFNPDGTERGKEIKYFDTAEQRSAAIKAYNQNKPDHEKAFVVKDPDVGTREAAERITAMYRRLRPEWKDLYKAMRNSNSEMLKTFKDSLCERIDEASNLDEEARIVFKKSILTRLAEAGMIHPYFTLGREGNHWLAAEVPNQYGAYESFVTAFQDTLSRSKMETELRNSVYKHELKKNLERGMGRQEAQQAAYDTALQNVRIYSNAQEIDYRRMPAGSVINDILGVIEKRKPGRTQGESDEAYRDRVQRFDEVEKDIMQMVINSLPETAFVKSLQKRKKTAGYSEDAVNVYERKTRSTARQISNLRFKPKVNASIDAMRKYADLLGRGQEEVKDPNTGEILQERVVPRDNKVQVDFLNEFTKHSNAAFNPSEKFISSTIRSALFGGTLGFNVSSGLIALSNLPMIVFPYLGSEYGMSATNKAMGEAYRVVRNSGNSRKATAFGSENASDVREEKMASGWSFGNYSPTSKEGRKYATLLEIASAAGQLNRSQLYENLMGSARTTSLDKFNAMSGWMLHTAERFNREVTLIAAYDLEMAKLKKEGITGQEAEIQAANKAVYAAEMANGSIAQSSAPRFAQSGLGSIVYMYKRFGATQYYLQAKTLYDSLKGEQDPKVRKMLTNRFWSLTGATAVMSGLQGLPMFGFAAMLYNLFKDDDDDDFNTVARKGLNELFYNGPIEYLTGLSVANRMGLSNLIIKEPRSSGESSSFSQTLLDSFGGPLPSMVDRFNRGIDKIQKGNIERGIEDLMPVAAANAMKATRYLIQGEARTLRGDTIYDDIGPGSAMATLFGFTPSEVARRMEFNAKEKGLSKAIQAKDSNIKGRYYKAWREHDAEGMRDAKRMLVELGAKHPDLGYNAGTVGQIMQDTVKLHESHTKRMLMGQEYPKKHLRSVHQSMKDLDIEP